MTYPDAAWERAMTVQEVILKALSGEIHWCRAADILGFSARSLRRWRERYEKDGYVGLVDKRRHSPSSGGLPRRRLNASCGSIGSGIADSMFDTFIRWRSASTG
jgi:hypothetical protein